MQFRYVSISLLLLISGRVQADQWGSERDAIVKAMVENEKQLSNGSVQLETSIVSSKPLQSSFTDQIKYQWKPGHELVEMERVEGDELPGYGFVYNPDYGFKIEKILLGSGEDRWSIIEAHAQYTIEGNLPFAISGLTQSIVESTVSLGSMRLVDVIQSSGFVLSDRSIDGARLVIEFQYQPAAEDRLPGDQRRLLRSLEAAPPELRGKFSLDRDRGFALISYDLWMKPRILGRSDTPEAHVIQTLEYVNVEAPEGDTFLLPKRLTREVESEQMERVLTCNTSNWSLETPPEENFRLSAYGLPEPSLEVSRHKLLGMLLLLLGCILAVVSVLIKRKKSTDESFRL